MTPSLRPIDQQVIVITGASSGIGLATALAAAAQGARLVLAARSGQALAEIARDIMDGGAEALPVTVDVGDRAQVERLAKEAVARFGRIDTWVNNAGVSIYGRIEEVSDEDNRRLFETNFWGTVNGALAALPHLKRQGGALVNVGSEVSDAVLPWQGMYAASKHAVKGFTDALRVELEVEKAPVSVTLIQPTAVDTPYPEHARNYMAREPKLPAPMIDPRLVAEAIIDAATHPRRDVTVGVMAKLNVMTWKLAPWLADLMARQQADRQQRDEAPRDPAGTLHRAGGAGNIYGRGTEGAAG